MGTRNLTIVIKDKKTKVAQYGQWDGYPTGQGETIANFLKTADLKKFKKQVDVLKEWTPKEIKDAYNEAGADPDSEWVSMDISEKVKQKYPELSRDYGAGILELIHNGTSTKVYLQEDFKKDTLYCEYCYEIDLDKKTVKMNGKKFTFDQWTANNFMKELEASEDEE